jgi:dTMP kinase
MAKFITVEGVEGVGKSTNIAFMESYFREKNLPLLTTREPGGTPFAEEIRALLLANREEGVVEDAELLLMFAARAQHLREKIIPALDKGQWVLCDRFTDATYAYQGAGRHVDMAKIARLEELIQGELRPDLTLLLDIDVEQGMQRVGDRGELDRFEQEQLDFFERVRQCYLERAASVPTRYRVIDASQPLEDVQKDIRQVLDDYIGTVA